MSPPDDTPPPAPTDILLVEDRLRATGRNDPCPCGSGKKYKKCCLQADETRVTSARRATLDALRNPARPPGVGEARAVSAYDDFIDIAGAPTDGTAAKANPAVASREWSNWSDHPVSPEVERELDGLWDEFNLLKPPTTEQMDAHLARLLALPPEGTDWPELFREFIRHRHGDLPGVFRRMAASVPPIKETSLGYFYWVAIEQFVSAGRSDLVPEIVAGFRTLDGESYDPDALHHVKCWVLAAGYEAEALALAEHFLSVMRGDDGLSHVVPEACREIFELRAGAALRRPDGPLGSPEEVAGALVRGIEEEIFSAFAQQDALIICDDTLAPTVVRSDFDLAADGAVGVGVESTRRFGMFLRVAREAWEIERRPPGIAFHGQWSLLNEVNRDRAEEPVRSKKARAKYPVTLNLLDCLHPSGLERRIARAANSAMGSNPPLAHLLIEAHATLLAFARRHALIEASLAEQTERELLELKTKLGFPA